MSPLSHRLFSHNVLMGSKHMLKCAPGTIHLSSIHSRHFHTHLHLFSTNPEKPTSKIPHISLKKHGFCSFAPVMHSRTVHLQPQEGEKTDMDKLAVLKMKLEKAGIACGSCKPGKYSRMLCPQVQSNMGSSNNLSLDGKWLSIHRLCGGGESKERSFSIFIREDGVDLEVQASVDGKGYSSFEKSSKGKPHRVITEESLELQPLCDELIAYFAERMISGETLRRNAVMQRSCLGDQIVIAFTYRRNGQLISCKYRGINKKFWQEKDTEKILYGVDDIKQASDIIIVEGEMDKLSMEEAGYFNCVSVPDGAPSQVSKKELPAEGEDTKYQYLWNCKEYIEKASRIILATDADAPGQALAEELARRLGRERCWRVKWPKKNDTDVCKDANEVLMFLGPEALREVIENAELYPIKGLFRFSDYFDEVDAYYHRSLGFEFGVSTGWMGLNELYNVVPGELTIVTGVPNSGKSEWIDALLCNINRSVGWKFALCSMENKVREHARKLLEKHIRKPFFNARYGESVERMSVEEFEQGKKWLNDTFHLIRCEDDCLPSIKWVLELAKAAVLRHGVRGLVIDPYNELDHQRPPNQTETEYVSQMLTKIKRFAQHHACHVWFVAHPRQLQHWVGGPPNLYDISGSAHFINKCDNGIVVHRNRDENAGPLDRVQICIRKVRNKVIGNIGDAFLSYNRTTGEFVDIDDAASRK